MSLRFFADHCVSNFIIKTLRNADHHVVRLRDYLPPDAPDPIVILKTKELGAILISLDGDFADIVTYPPVNYHGIIALQVRNHPEILPDLMGRLIAYLSAYPGMDHYKGKLFLVEIHRIRIRE